MAREQLIWRVRIDTTIWTVDMAAASMRAGHDADRWRLRLQRQGGIAHDDLLACRAEDHDGLDLPGRVKTRIPDASAPDINVSPWGAVFRYARDRNGLSLALLAYGLRHPRAALSHQPSVYERAHRRLSAGR